MIAIRRWFAEAERVHSRWAMLAVAGILAQVRNRAHVIYVVHGSMRGELPTCLASSLMTDADS